MAATMRLIVGGGTYMCCCCGVVSVMWCWLSGGGGLKTREHLGEGKKYVGGMEKCEGGGREPGVIYLLHLMVVQTSGASAQTVSQLQVLCYAV